MTTLVYGSWDRTPDISWNGRETFYRNCEGKQEICFSDGLTFPLRGHDGRDEWEAHHGDGSGWGHCFTLSGETLTVSPRTVRAACESDGYVDALGLAPREWCDSGFPFDMFFMVVEVNNTRYKRKPENLFEAGLFLREDVIRIRDGARSPVADAQVAIPKPGKIRSDREENLLRVIAGLWALSGLPAEHNTTADKLSGLFDTWGWDKPKKSSIADDTLKQAANLPGARIRTSD